MPEDVTGGRREVRSFSDRALAAAAAAGDVDAVALAAEVTRLRAEGTAALREAAARRVLGVTLDAWQGGPGRRQFFIACGADGRFPGRSVARIENLASWLNLPAGDVAEALGAVAATGATDHWAELLGRTRLRAGVTLAMSSAGRDLLTHEWAPPGRA